MTRKRHRWVSDVVHRAAGAVLVTVAAACIFELYRSVHIAPRHDGSIVEMGLAAVGFLSASAGCVLMFLGTHVHDRVEVAERWRVVRMPGVTRALPSQKKGPTAEPGRMTYAPVFRSADRIAGGRAW